MSADVLDDLEWRGLVAQTTDLAALRAELAGGMLTLYAGFDPTGASLHLGHLVQVLTLRRFQEAGHRPIVVAGGATGLIGDPREVGERVMLSHDVVESWTEAIRDQLARYLTFDGSPSGALAVNNLDWTGELSAIDLLRDVGKHFSVNVMIGRETVRRRLDSDGISFTEFSYLLLQSLDYVELFRRHGCRLQIGGSDQWGNIVGGVDLVRRVEGAAVHALTTPLVTDAHGEKFGKSTGGGRLWLDPSLTSPYVLFQYLLNVDDADVGRYLRYFTFLSHGQIEALDGQTAARPAAREAQRALAREVTTLVHGAEQTDQAEAAGRALFGGGELRELSGAVLDAALAEVPHVEATRSDRTLADLLVETELTASRSAARRAIAEGGAYVNNVRVEDPDWTAAQGDLLTGRWLVLRRGKRSVAGVRMPD